MWHKGENLATECSLLVQKKQSARQNRRKFTSIFYLKVVRNRQNSALFVDKNAFVVYTSGRRVALKNKYAIEFWFYGDLAVYV